MARRKMLKNLPRIYFTMSADGSLSIVCDSAVKLLFLPAAAAASAFDLSLIFRHLKCPS